MSAIPKVTDLGWAATTVPGIIGKPSELVEPAVEGRKPDECGMGVFMTLVPLLRRRRA